MKRVSRTVWHTHTSVFPSFFKRKKSFRVYEAGSKETKKKSRTCGGAPGLTGFGGEGLGTGMVFIF